MSKLGVCSSAAGLAGAAAAGAKHIRCDAPWGDLDACEQMFAASQGRWWPLLGYSDPAGGDVMRAPTQQDVVSYAAWCAAFAERFAGRVQAIELRNEPNLQMFWTPQSTTTPEAAGALTSAAVKAVREVNASVTIVASAIADSDGTSKVRFEPFLRRYWAAVKDKQGVVPAIHPYVFGPVSYKAAHEITGTRVAVTEYGIDRTVHNRAAALTSVVGHLVTAGAYAVLGYSFDDPNFRLGQQLHTFIG